MILPLIRVTRQGDGAEGSLRSRGGKGPDVLNLRLGADTQTKYKNDVRSTSARASALARTLCTGHSTTKPTITESIYIEIFYSLLFKITKVKKKNTELSIIIYKELYLLDIRKIVTISIYHRTTKYIRSKRYINSINNEI